MFGLISATAQPPKMNDKAKEKIKAFRIAFFTEKLALTPEESKNFWPLYDEFEQKQKAIRKQLKGLMDQDLSLLSDQQVTEMATKHLDLREAELKLEREYLGKFQTVMPTRKVVQLHRVERQFRDELLRIMQNRRDKQGGPGHTPPPHGHLPPPHD